MLTELGFLFGEGFGDGDPDCTCASVGWEAEGCVGSPISCCLLKDHVLCDVLEVRVCNTLAEPLALHLP